MSIYKTRLLRLVHGALLVLLIAGGTLGSVTALGSQDADTYCAAVADQLPLIERRINAAASVQQGIMDTESQQINVMIRQLQADETDLYRTIDSARDRNLAPIPNHGAYQDTITRLGGQRRQAVRAADQQFARGLRRVIDTRHATLAGRVDAYRISVTDALRAADVTCAQTDDALAGRPVLSAALQKADAGFQSQSDADEGLTTTIQQLIRTKQAAIRAANQTYLLAAVPVQRHLQMVIDNQ
jgi:hypothetical protein